MDRTDAARDRGASWAPPSPGDAASARAGRDGAGADDVDAAGRPGASGPDPTFGDRVRELTQRVGLEVDVPFDSFGDAVRWWFRPLADVRTWRSFLSILAAAVIGPILFGFAVAALAVTAVLSLVLVGLLLVVPAFALVRSFSTVGRKLAGWGVDDPIAPRPVATSGSGLLAPITRRLTDESRWRDVGFVLLDTVVAPLFLLGALLPITGIVGSLASVVVEGDSFGTIDIVDVTFETSFFQILLLVPLLGLVARLVLLAGRLRRGYVAALVGPDRRTQLVERVEELSVQRDQVLDAVAAERRRIERNLHDGVQQQLVALGIDIGRASRKLDDDPAAARELLDEAREKVRASIGELRLIGRGLHPAVLEDRGLDAALSAIVASSPIPVSVDVTTDHELPQDVAETAYYLVNEAMTNVLKYAGARAASVRVDDEPGLLPAVRVTIRDDGRGGADERRGSGIAGMRARVEAVDGAFVLSSPAGGPTAVTAVIPIRRERVQEPENEPTPERTDRATTRSER
ncbi:MAG: sensor domain-containing protein [Actinomycetota bacterium]